MWTYKWTWEWTKEWKRSVRGIGNRLNNKSLFPNIFRTEEGRRWGVIFIEGIEESGLGIIFETWGKESMVRQYDGWMV